MAHFIDAEGKSQQVVIDKSIYREAAEAEMSVEQYINDQYVTGADQPSAFKQIQASLGLYMKADRKEGIRPTKLKDVVNGTGVCSAATPGTKPDVPESRILFPAAVLSTIEDKLARDLTTASAAFNQLVAIEETIPGTEFKRAILNFDRPSGYRMRATAQLARPQNMAVLTMSERSLAIPTVALGIQWSDKVENAPSIDIIALSVARQAAVEHDERANQAILSLLNGDSDLDMAPLSSVNPYVTAASLDPAATAGKLTQTAWIKWLYQGRNFRAIDWIVTDIDGALAIQNREGRPVVTQDDGTSPRINTDMVIANPLIPAKVNVFVTDNPDWPTGTIMGMDKRFAVQRVNSASADYQATENDLIARSSTMRWDTGFAAVRLYDEAFSVLTF